MLFHRLSVELKTRATLSFTSGEKAVFLKQDFWFSTATGSPLTTDKCPFFALVTSSSDPAVKSMTPSFPWPTINWILRERAETFRRRRRMIGPADPHPVIEEPVRANRTAGGRVQTESDHTIQMRPGPTEGTPTVREILSTSCRTLSVQTLLKTAVSQDLLMQDWTEPALTCPGWCWCCWFCRHRWRSWSRSRLHARFAKPRPPEKNAPQTCWVWKPPNISPTTVLSYLLFVVVTGHVQNEQAVAERADRDAWGRREQQSRQNHGHVFFILLLDPDLWALRSRCAASVCPPPRWWQSWRWAAAGGSEPCSPSGRTWSPALRTEKGGEVRLTRNSRCHGVQTELRPPSSSHCPEPAAPWGWCSLHLSRSRYGGLGLSTNHRAAGITRPYWASCWETAWGHSEGSCLSCPWRSRWQSSSAPTMKTRVTVREKNLSFGNKS